MRHHQVDVDETDESEEHTSKDPSFPTSLSNMDNASLAAYTENERENTAESAASSKPRKYNFYVDLGN